MAEKLQTFTYLCIMVWRSRSAAGEALDCEDMAKDGRPNQDLGDAGLTGLRPTARPVRVGTALEDLAALSRCNGRGRRNESCRERSDRRRLVARRGGGLS